MSWCWLLAAGVVEVAWAMSIKPTEGFTRPVSARRIVALGIASPE